MTAVESPRRVLVLHAPPDWFSGSDRAVLARLGYALFTPEEFEEQGRTLDRPRPDLRLVDERQLGEVPEDSGPCVPIVALTGRHGVTGVDPRIVGALPRPPGMHDVYRVAQQVLEDTPRNTVRVPVHLSARCRRRGREWRGVVLSLSENGCLLRSTEPLTLGARLELSFRLARVGELTLEAESAYQLVPDFGLIFHATAPADRQGIARYVAEALETL
jgi:hypothetical protein